MITIIALIILTCVVIMIALGTRNFFGADRWETWGGVVVCVCVCDVVCVCAFYIFPINGGFLK